MSRLPPDLEEQKTTQSSKVGSQQTTAQSNELYRTTRDFIEEDIQESSSLITAKKVSATDDDMSVRKQREKL